MKQTVLGMILAAVLFLAPFALAIDFMGPPTATLRQGEFKPDFTYNYSENDVELKNVNTPVDYGRIEFDDLDLNRYYGTFDYGLNDRWEAYGKAGAGSVESGDADFAYGWGTRLTAIDGETIDWGVGFLMSWLEAEDQDGHLVCIDAQRHEGRFDFDLYEMQLMAGPTISFDGWKLYGGVFYYRLEGDFDGKVTGPTLMSAAPIKGDLDEASDVGSYVGAVLDLADNMNAMIETAVIDGGWAIGANIGWLF